MTFINPQKKQVSIKVIYFGPAQAGKSNILSHLYKQLDQSDTKGTLKKLKGGYEQSLCLDFVPLTLGKVKGQTLHVHLYSVPNSLIYEANRRLIFKGVDSIVFVADSQITRLQDNIDCLDDPRKYLLDEYTSYAEMPVVFQYNKRDLPTALPVAVLEKALNPEGRPSFESSVVRKQGLMEPLQAAIKQSLQALPHEV